MTIEDNTVNRPYENCTIVLIFLEVLTNFDKISSSVYSAITHTSNLEEYMEGKVVIKAEMYLLTRKMPHRLHGVEGTANVILLGLQKTSEPTTFICKSHGQHL